MHLIFGGVKFTALAVEHVIFKKRSMSQIKHKHEVRLRLTVVDDIFGLGDSVTEMFALTTAGL